MARCEDAPCCGCCGHAVEAREFLAEQEYYGSDDRYYDEF